MAVTKYLDKTGLSHFWSKIKAWCTSLFALDNAVVHKTGNETIRGHKSFVQPSLIVQNPYVELGTFETSYENYHNNLEIFLADKNYDPNSGSVPIVGTTRLGEIQWQRRGNSGGDSFELTLRGASDPEGPFVLGSIGIIHKPLSGAWFGYCPSTPLPSVDNSANAIVTRNFIPLDTRIVHTTDNESIAGIKTFSSSPIVPTPAAGDSSTKVASTAFVNTALSNYLPLSGGTMTGAITRTGQLANTGSDTSSSIHICNGTGANGGGGIWLYGKDHTSGVGKVRLQSYNGTYYRFDVNSDGTSATNTIFTISKGNSTVNSPAILMYGNSQNYMINAVDTSVTKGTAPSANKYWGINFFGKDYDHYNKRIGLVETTLFTNNVAKTSIIAYDCTTNTNTNICAIRAIVDGNGNAYTEAPKPSDTTDNSTKIATTSWIRTATGNSNLYSKGIYNTNYTSGTHDFDDYKENGVYSFSSDTTLTNCPSGVNGTLFVFGEGGWVRQLFIRSGTINTNDHNFYFRVKTIGDTGVWSNWHKVYTDSDIIPIVNGGTGSSTQNFVDLSNTQTVEGAKSFSSSVNVLHSVARGTNPSSNTYKQFNFLDSSATNSTSKRAANIENLIASTGDVSLYLRAYKWAATGGANANLEIKYPIDGDPSLLWNGSDIIKHATICSNCNAALDAGLYKTTSSTTNAPDTFGGILTVERADDGSRVWQTVKSYTTDYYKPIWTRQVILNANGAYSSATAWTISNYIPTNAARSLFNNSISGKLAFCPPDGTSLRGQTGSNYEFMRLYHGRDWTRDATGESYGYIGRYSATTSPTATSSNQAQFIIGESCGGISSNNFSFGCYYQCASDVVYTDTTTERVYGVYLKAGDTYNNKTVDSVTYFRNTNNKPWIRYNYDNICTLGDGSYRFSTVYAGTGTINTSDERLKDDISNIPDKILDVWDSIEWVQFKFKESIQEKGNNARIHVGAIAQSIDNNFKNNNIDISSYGFFCYDKWEEEWDEDENGIKQKIKDSGDRYSLRYEEALCIEAAYQRRKNKILENRISELENQLSSVLQTLKELKGVG